MCCVSKTDRGLKGWGEVCPIPHYLPGFADGVPSAIREMTPEILGIAPTGIDAPMCKLDGYLAAKSSVDNALRDLFGTTIDLPLCHSITCIALGEMAHLAHEAYATGLLMKIDEGAYDLASLIRAVKLGRLDAVALKLSKFGGLSAMRRARDLTSQSEWIERAQAVLPAGGFGHFDPGIIIACGDGSHVWDEDGYKYLDYLIGSGPMALGHLRVLSENSMNW